MLYDPAFTVLASAGTFATNPVLAQQQADSLRGNALRSLEQFKALR